MANQPRIPSSVAEWEAIDIFIFSNGQEYSPPRKYHLRADDLNYWDATLSFLARAQYGSMHSCIELYTLDGRKVESPVELSYGRAYVAVVPPDSFIDTGYEKYVMRASRSWEKRQSRRSSSTDPIPQSEIVAIKTQQSNSELNKDIVNIVIPGQNIIIETLQNSIKIAESATETNQHQVVVNIPQNVQKCDANVKQVEKRKPLTSHNTRTSILRKLNHPAQPSLSVKKPPPKKREIISKSNMKPVTTKFNDTGGVVLADNNKTVARAGIISTSPRGAATNTPPSTKVDQVVEISSVTEVIPNHKSLLTNSTQADYIIEDKDVIVVSNYNKSKDSEIMSMFLDAENFILYPAKQNNNYSKQSTNTPTTTSTSIATSERDGFKLIMQEPQAAEICDTTKPTDLIENEITTSQTKAASPLLLDGENFIAVLNNGDVNLQLNIEMLNEDGVINTVQTNITNRSRSVIDMNNENNSKANITEEIKESKSLHSLHNKCCCCRDHEKMAVLQCACDQDNQGNVPQIESKTGKENKTYFIIIPIVTHIANACHRPEQDTHKLENDTHQVEKSTHQLEKSTQQLEKSTHYLEKSTHHLEKEVQKTESQPKLIIVSSTTETVMTFPMSIEYKENLVCSVYDHTLKSSQISHHVEELQKVGFVGAKRGLNELNILRDSSTQTEWCSVMLEVRRHDDGRYTFHLPTIELLKSYKI